MTRDQLRRLIIAACLVGAIVLFASGMPGFEG